MVAISHSTPNVPSNQLSARIWVYCAQNDSFVGNAYTNFVRSPFHSGC